MIVCRYNLSDPIYDPVIPGIYSLTTNDSKINNDLMEMKESGQKYG